MSMAVTPNESTLRPKNRHYRGHHRPLGRRVWIRRDPDALERTEGLGLLVPIPLPRLVIVRKPTMPREETVQAAFQGGVLPEHEIGILLVQILVHRRQSIQAPRGIRHGIAIHSRTCPENLAVEADRVKLLLPLPAKLEIARISRQFKGQGLGLLEILEEKNLAIGRSRLSQCVLRRSGLQLKGQFDQPSFASKKLRLADHQHLQFALRPLGERQPSLPADRLAQMARRSVHRPRHEHQRQQSDHQQQNQQLPADLHDLHLCMNTGRMINRPRVQCTSGECMRFPHGSCDPGRPGLHQPGSDRSFTPVLLLRRLLADSCENRWHEQPRPLSREKRNRCAVLPRSAPRVRPRVPGLTYETLFSRAHPCHDFSSYASAVTLGVLENNNV